MTIVDSDQTTPELAPLSIGELLDVSIKLYVTNAITLIGLVIAIVLPAQAVIAVMQVSATARAGETTSGVTRAQLGLVVVTLVLSVLVGALASAACFKAVGDAYLGRRASALASFRFAVRFLLPVLLVTCLATVGTMFGVIAVIIGAVYLWVRWCVAIPALLMENVRGRKALKRSSQLVKGRWWTCFGVMMIGNLLIAVMAAIIALVISAVATRGLHVHGDTARWAVQTLAGTIGAGIGQPLVACFTVILYFDLRVRREGFDLQLLARRVGIEPAGPQ